MICKIPCCDCEKYFVCKEFIFKNRCRKCIHYKDDILGSVCLKCRGFDLAHKDKEDLFQSYDK